MYSGLALIMSTYLKAFIQSFAKYLMLFLSLLKEIIIFANDIQTIKNYRLIKFNFKIRD